MPGPIYVSTLSRRDLARRRARRRRLVLPRSGRWVAALVVVAAALERVLT